MLYANIDRINVTGPAKTDQVGTENLTTLFKSVAS